MNKQQLTLHVSPLRLRSGQGFTFSVQRREAALLGLGFAFLLVAFLSLSIAPAVRLADWGQAQRSWRYVLSLTAWAVAALFGHRLLNRRLPHRDTVLFPTAMFLCGWGLVLIHRLAPPFGLRQTVWLVVGVAALAAVVRAPADLRWLRRYRYLWLFGGLSLTALTLLFGVNPSGFGPRLWLGCCGRSPTVPPGGGLYLQPSEALKLLLVIYLAAYLAEKRDLLVSARRIGPIELPTAFFWPMLLMWGFSVLLLVSQRDLGTGSLLFAIFLVMLYLAIGRAAYVALGIALLLIGGAAAYSLFDVVQVRVEAWVNPWVDASGDSYQIVQSLIAVAAGGLFGRGLGVGAPRVIPVVHSDFIFAAIVEEWGLLGGLAGLALLAVLVFRALRLAALARGSFRALLAGGLGALLGLQTILIIGGVVKALPLTGVTLPFVSYGGSALVANFILLGLLLRLSSNEQSRSKETEKRVCVRGVRPARTPFFRSFPLRRL